MKDYKNIFNRKILISTNILFLFSIIILLFIIFSAPTQYGKNVIKRDENYNYIFTSPILDCEYNDQGDESVLSYKILNDKVIDLQKKYSLNHVSLYFRDLNNGPWVGVNEKETFSPASLLKVPILMSYLREAEGNPPLLDKKVKVTQSDIDQGLRQNIQFENLLALGKEYSLRTISESMIQKSDNTAIPILLRNINSDNIMDVFRSVGVPFKDTTSEVNVQVKDYAGFFRVLYNASYLNRQMSEMALSILSESEYNNGLVAGVPKDIKIAHKFGERSLNSSDFQLHDCGIIYYPGKPYILCVMTRGSDFKKQEKVIQELSSYVYSEVDKK